MIWNFYRDNLENFCKELASQYNTTLEGYYRIKYNSLYPILYDDLLTEEKKEELWNSFRTSLDIDPILEINDDKIVFRKV